jgi:hypothetical protein
MRFKKRRKLTNPLLHRLVHNVHGLDKQTLGLCGLIHGYEILVELLKMLLQVPILHGLIGLGHVHPEVQNSCLSKLTVFRIHLVLESLLKVLLYRPHNVTLLREISIVPALV